jgi:RNA polymerase-binding transcription factor DksA
MADPADIAGETIVVCIQEAVARVRGKSAPEHDARFDGAHCVEEDCGVALPRERLNLGRVRCVDCQALAERRRALRQHNIST